MDLMDVIAKLNEETVDPVYLVHGPESFLIDQFLGALKELVLVGPMADLNYSRKKASETTGAAIVAEARSMPMFTRRRLIIVDDAEKLKATDTEALEPYLADPVVQSCVVLVAEKLDLRKGMTARANKRGQVHKADSLKENQLAAFVRSRAKARNIKLGPGVDAAVSVAVGADCAALDDAVERLGLYAGEGKAVTEGDVGEVVTAVRQHSVFELVEAMGNRRQAQALALLEELIGRREEPLRLNALLARHFRQLIGARAMMSQRADPGTIASQLGVPPFVAKKLSAQAQRFRGVELEWALFRLARADLELKSSRRQGRLVLEQTIMDLSLMGEADHR